MTKAWIGRHAHTLAWKYSPAGQDGFRPQTSIPIVCLPSRRRDRRSLLSIRQPLHQPQVQVALGTPPPHAFGDGGPKLLVQREGPLCEFLRAVAPGEPAQA